MTTAGTIRPQRFRAPAPPVSVTRFRHSGLGSDASEQVPATEDPAIHAQEIADRDTGFAGLASRSRFVFVPSIPQGHGSAATATPQPTRGRDPAADMSNFDDLNDNFPPSLGEGPYRSEFDASLGQTGPRLVRDGVLSYIRRSFVERSAGTHAADLPRWSDAGPVPRSIRFVRFTLRREFMQDAQNYLGLRGVAERGAHVSTSPVRMLPPLTSRLTVRDLPRSFGNRTEVVS